MPLFRHKDALTDSCGSIISDLRPSRSFDVDIVPCFKFDDVRQNLDLGEIGFVKIDVEGAELETLMGMEMSVRECQPIILCKADPLYLPSGITDKDVEVIRREQNTSTSTN